MIEIDTLSIKKTAKTAEGSLPRFGAGGREDGALHLFQHDGWPGRSPIRRDANGIEVIEVIERMGWEMMGDDGRCDITMIHGVMSLYELYMNYI